MALTKNSQPVKVATKVVKGATFDEIVKDCDGDTKLATSRIRSAVAAYRNHAETLSGAGKQKEADACNAICAKLLGILPKGKRRGRAAGEAVSDSDILALAEMVSGEADDADGADDATETE